MVMYWNLLEYMMGYPLVIINHPFSMVGIPPMKMVMNGGWSIIAIPTLGDFLVILWTSMGSNGISLLGYMMVYPLVMTNTLRT